MPKLKDKSRKCLEKIKNTNWQGHFGDVLNKTALIVDSGIKSSFGIFLASCFQSHLFFIVVGGFPGSGIVAKALEFGGTLLNAKATGEEKKILRKQISSLGESQEVLKKQLEDVLQRMENQTNEVRDDWDKIQDDMMRVFNDIKIESGETADAIKQIKDVALHARIMLEDLKYKVISVALASKVYILTR